MNPQMEVKGDEKDLIEFLKVLEKQNIPFTIPYRDKASESYPAKRIFIHVLESVIVEFSKKTVETIINWLKERKKKGLKNPRLKVTVEGNILDLNPEDMKRLADILDKASKERKPKREGVRNRTRSTYH